MDIRAHLHQGTSRNTADAIADHVGSDPRRFKELMRCMLDDDRRTGQLASHAATIVCDRHPELVAPYVARLLGTLGSPVHEAVQRNSIRMMQTCPLPKNLHGRITEAMFERIADPGASIAQRAFAITVAMRMVQLYPELKQEMTLLLEDALRVDPGPAVRSRAGKALKVLRKAPYGLGRDRSTT